MNLREIWKEDTILDAGGNRSARRKPPRVSIDRETNSHTTLARLGTYPGRKGTGIAAAPTRPPKRKRTALARQTTTITYTNSIKL